MSDQTITDEQRLAAKRLATLFGTLNWRLSFSDFCALLALDPQHDHAARKWRDFQQLCVALAAFDGDGLARLLAHGELTVELPTAL